MSLPYKDTSNNDALSDATLKHVRNLEVALRFLPNEVITAVIAESNYEPPKLALDNE